MPDFSFLHVSDIHLARPFSGLSAFSYDEKLNEVCINAVEKSFNKMIDYALKNNIDFIFISGDTFDSDAQDFSSKLILKRGLKRLENEGIRVYLICGNHDPVNSYSRNTFNYTESSIIKIIGLNTPHACSLPLYTRAGLEAGTVHALSFTEEKFNENPVKYLKKAQTGFNAGLLHCSINAENSSPYAPCSISELKGLNYDYYALGHIHLPCFEAENIYYSGTLQGRNTKETGIHGCRHIKVSNGNIIKNAFAALDIIRFEDITADITSALDSSSALDIIENSINEKVSLNNSEDAEIYLIRPFITGITRCFSEINNDFYNSLADRIKSDFSGRVYISHAECSILPEIENETLENDAGISGELYRTLNNQQYLTDAFNPAEESIKNLISDCSFTHEEYENFKKNVIQSASAECRNLCSLIYEDRNIEE